MFEATAIFAYLVPAGMRAVAPKLRRAMRRGARVVTYVFSLPGCEPKAMELYKGTKIYLYEGGEGEGEACGASVTEPSGAPDAALLRQQRGLLGLVRRVARQCR